jgi:hypothetical protein
MYLLCLRALFVCRMLICQSSEGGSTTTRNVSKFNLCLSCYTRHLPCQDWCASNNSIFIVVHLLWVAIGSIVMWKWGENCQYLRNYVKWNVNISPLTSEVCFMVTTRDERKRYMAAHGAIKITFTFYPFTCVSFYHHLISELTFVYSILEASW